MDKLKIKENFIEFHESIKENPVALQISMMGKPRGVTTDVATLFLKLFPNLTGISSTNFSCSSSKEISTPNLIKKLKEDGWVPAVENQTFIAEENFFKPIVVALVKDPGYIITITPSYRTKNRRNNSIDEKYQDIHFSSDTFYNSIIGEEGVTDSFTVFHPNRWDELYDHAILEKIAELLKESIIVKNEIHSIGMIACSEEDGYYVKDFSLDSKYQNFNHLDLHYGEGFEKFNNDLLERIKEKNKGLVLFHGEPGTGKTQYIRYLLKELSMMNKTILYAPPTLSSSMLDPSMLDFLSDWILENEKDCILLIEDAEPLLESRKGGEERSTGISNLLNMTDGLLNDILGLMVIATFNTDLNNIDKALLRPHRLIARKQFQRITLERGLELQKLLGINNHEIVYPATLAEFYSTGSIHKTLIHDVEEKRRIGFGM